MGSLCIMLCMGDLLWDGLAMNNIINEWGEKGFHICIIPQISDGKWWWCPGIYIGMSKSAEWIRPKDADGPIGSFSDYEKALEAAIDFCTNYKPKTQHGSKKATKR
jgi:hypothetical protein